MYKNKNKIRTFISDQVHIIIVYHTDTKLHRIDQWTAELAHALYFPVPVGSQNNQYSFLMVKYKSRDCSGGGT
jgi:hypothetical protein